MRRPLVALTILSCLGLAACEDGPTQTFAPAPSGAGNQWNDGQSPGSSDPSQQGFATQTGGNNAMEICTGSQLATRWAKMVQEPIVPPTTAAGLDISGGPTWVGMTIEEAEKINCQSTSNGDQFGDGSAVNSWGDNGEVWVDYNVQTHKIGFMTLWPGYAGTIDMTSRDGANTYKIYVYQQSTKNGQPFTFDWAFPATPKFSAEVNELYDALTATFAPGLPQDPDCINSGACVTGKFGDVAYIYFPAIGTGFWVPTWTQPQPAPSILYRVDLYLTKTLPFSLNNVELKLDAVGPQGLGGLLGTATTPCTMQLGMTFDAFTKSCVAVTSDATKNQTEQNKLLGGISHGDESWSFDVQGIDLNFRDLTLPPDQVITDTNLPTPDDPAVTFSADQSTLGKILNDYKNHDVAQGKDNHGAGLVYLEYARIVQDALNADILAADPTATVHQLGAPECTTGVDPVKQNYPPNCTGFEGFVTAWAGPMAGGPSTGDPGLDKLAIGYKNANSLNSAMALGLKPGHPTATFCLDPTGDMTTGYKHCNVPGGEQGDIFSTSFDRITQVLGQGHVYNLPIDAQDVRFFWKAYFTALVKYLKAAGTGAETPDQIHAITLDPDDLFFDSLGSGQFEIGEYVDRSAASKTQGPTDINVTADVKNGIFNDYNFSRELYRGETALYSATLENQSDGIGEEHTALLTNVFGSPVLSGGWTGAAATSTTPAYSAYQCATGGYTAASPQIDPAVVSACGNQPVPLDDTGKPRLLRYPGAFAPAGSTGVQSSTAFTLGATPIKLLQTYSSIQQAMVSIPITQNPYDPSSPSLAPLSVLVPWAPKQPGVGFPIAVTGTLDKFVETAQLDFSGTTISANVDYDLAIDPKTLQPMTDGSLNFKAVETTDFLGEIFVCQDSATKDILGVRMYTPVAAILDWLAQHTNAYADCGIIITYSPYGNFADYITSLTNGVRLNITQGGGFGRVVDVTLFVPGQ